MDGHLTKMRGGKRADYANDPVLRFNFSGAGGNRILETSKQRAKDY
jgi:hypothetical protein